MDMASESDATKLENFNQGHRKKKLAAALNSLSTSKPFPLVHLAENGKLFLSLTLTTIQPVSNSSGSGFLNPPGAIKLIASPAFCFCLKEFLFFNMNQLQTTEEVFSVPESFLETVGHHLGSHKLRLPPVGLLPLCIRLKLIHTVSRYAAQVFRPPRLVRVGLGQGLACVGLARRFVPML